MTKILEIEGCLKCPFRQSLAKWQPDFCIRVGKTTPTIKTFPKWCPLPDKPDLITGEWLEELFFSLHNKYKNNLSDDVWGDFFEEFAECINKFVEVEDG